MSQNYLVSAYWKAKKECGKRVRFCLELIHSYKFHKERVYSFMSSAIGVSRVSLFRKKIRLGDFEDVTFHELVLFESVVFHLVELVDHDKEVERLFNSTFTAEDFNI